MSPVVEQLPRGGRVLIIRLRSLADCVLTTPALSLLHEYRPDLHIAVMADHAFRPVFEHNPDLFLLPQPTLPEALAFRPHLTLNLHGGTRSMQLTAASLARWRAGFAHHSLSRLYNVRIPRAQEILGEERTVHTTEHLASAMFFLGVPVSDIPRARLHLPPSTVPEAPHGPLAIVHPFAAPPEQTWPAGRFLLLAAHLRDRLLLPPSTVPEAPHGPLPLVHPFAAAPEKTWPAERFLLLAGHLRDRMGLSPLIIGSDKDDFTPFREFPCFLGAPLDEIKKLMSMASLFVGNDSGPAHMAAAFGLPVLVFFGPSDEVVWRPWRTKYELLKNAAGCAAIPFDDALAALSRLEVKP